jgi:hypothetical protein
VNQNDVIAEHLAQQHKDTGPTEDIFTEPAAAQPRGVMVIFRPGVLSTTEYNGRHFANADSWQWEGNTPATLEVLSDDGVIASFLADTVVGAQYGDAQ